MEKKRVVLVTGVAGHWGTRVAMQLLAEPGLRLVGLDVDSPREDIKGLDFIQADIRNPLLVDLLKSENVQTVCHLAFVESMRLSETAFDINVMGTLKVMGACVEAGVGKVVLKSSTAVYGAQPSNSAFLTEAHPLNGSRRYGYTRDLVEIELFCNGFRRQAPQVALTILRFPNIIGLACDTPMTRFLKDVKAPVLLGFDPLMQVIHEDDVVGALVHAILTDVPGVFNVAADKALPLSQLMALAGKAGVPVLHLLAYWTLPLGSSQLAPIEWDYIRYPWVGDLKKMRGEFGFTPRYTAAEALREFAAQQRVHRYLPESAVRAFDEERLRDTIERRRRAREQAATEQGDDHG
jgi:UDP-glucose 4-epimerase